MLVSTLRLNGVDDRFVVRRSAPSTLAFVSLAGIGSPEFAFFNRGAADTLLVPRDVPLPLFPMMCRLCALALFRWSLNRLVARCSA